MLTRERGNIKELAIHNLLRGSQRFNFQPVTRFLVICVHMTNIDS